jgi:CRISPR-associated endonuclease/helicase Cas3
MLEIYPDDVVKMPSFNKCNYQLEFVEYDEDKLDDTNPLYQPQEKSTFVISNTATTAQLSYLKNQQQENAVLFHSKFTKSDKQKLFDLVFNCFKQHGSGKFEVLRSGPIMQASLNITSNGNMISEITTAENLLQRLGRRDRFGENTTGINTLIIAIPQNFTKKQGAVARFLAKNNCLATTIKWYQFLLAKTTNNKLCFTLEQMYNWYQEFHDIHGKIIIQDLISALQQSAKVITNKLNSPLVISNKKATSKIKIAFRSIRSDNRFVQMAVCDLTNNEINYTNTYKVDIVATEADSITESIDRLQALGLIEHAAKKDARINPNSSIEGVPKKQRENLLISLAREQEQPIYLSYTRDDLNKIGESKNHSNAMFYTKTDRQAVGSLNLKQFKGMQQCKK